MFLEKEKTCASDGESPQGGDSSVGWRPGEGTANARNINYSTRCWPVGLAEGGRGLRQRLLLIKRLQLPCLRGYSSAFSRYWAALGTGLAKWLGGWPSPLALSGSESLRDRALRLQREGSFSATPPRPPFVGFLVTAQPFEERSEEFLKQTVRSRWVAPALRSGCSLQKTSWDHHNNPLSFASIQFPHPGGRESQREQEWEWREMGLVFAGGEALAGGRGAGGSWAGGPVLGPQRAGPRALLFLVCPVARSPYQRP